MKLLDNHLTRREFLKVSGTVAVLSQIQPVSAQEWLAQVGKTGSKPDMVGDSAKIVRSVCLMCHSGCGIQCTIVNGELVKIDGNPYHPNTYDYVAKGDIVEESDLDGGLNGRDVGTLCAKGQAGIYALYSPARLKHPLTRVGPRGAGKWKTISWDQALKEITEGGLLFKGVPGEEKRQVEGLKHILNNDKPIGPEDSNYMDEAPPEGWGPKRNQFVWAHGRNEQSPLTPRFVVGAAGVPNMLNHCDRCAGTFYNVVEHTLNVPPYEIGAYADYEYTTFLISVGSNITHADYPGQTKARYLQKLAKRTGPDAKKFKHVIVDPWLSPAAAKALQSGKGEWIPLKPSTDAFFLLGMLRWMIENKAYKADFLAVPNEQAAKKTGRRNWSDMTYLVRTKEPKLYLSGKDAGLGQSRRHDRPSEQGVFQRQAAGHRNVPWPNPAVQRLVERPGADHPEHPDGQHRSQGRLHPRPQGLRRLRRRASTQGHGRFHRSAQGQVPGQEGDLDAAMVSTGDTHGDQRVLLLGQARLPVPHQGLSELLQRSGLHHAVQLVGHRCAARPEGHTAHDQHRRLHGRDHPAVRLCPAGYRVPGAFWRLQDLSARQDTCRRLAAAGGRHPRSEDEKLSRHPSRCADSGRHAPPTCDALRSAGLRQERRRSGQGYLQFLAVLERVLQERRLQGRAGAGSE